MTICAEPALIMATATEGAVLIGAVFIENSSWYFRIYYYG